MKRNQLLATMCLTGVAMFGQQPFSRDEWRRDSRDNRDGVGGLYEIVNVENGKALDLDRRDGRTVIQYESRGTRNQMWEVRRGGGGRYNLVNAMNGAALTELSPRRSTPVEAYPLDRRNNAAQEWRIESYRDGTVMLISYSGKALDVPDGSWRDGARLQTYDRNGDGNQRFFLRPVNQSRQPEYRRPR
jgi:hypothetical protein